MIQVKEMMQDNDLKNSKSKDKGSKSRSQSMDEQSHYKQDKTITRQSINVKRHIFNVIGGTEELKAHEKPSPAHLEAHTPHLRQKGINIPSPHLVKGELEAHYMYMAQIQEVTPDPVDNSGPIFDDEPMHKVTPYHYDSLDICLIEPEMIQDDTDDLDQERDLLASLIQKLKCEINDSKNQNKFLESSNKALVDKLKGCYNDNLALMLSPESDETIRLDKESRSKLSDLIRPFDYDQLNNLYDLFVPQREKSPEQHYFPTTSKMSHTSSNKEISKESFHKQTTLLEKRMDKSIPWDQKYLKAQLQDKGIAISELKKLIEKMKGKYVETKFEKSSVIRQPNAFKSQRQSILGKPATFSDSLAKTDFSKSKSVTTQNVSHDFSKPVTAQILPQNVLPIFKNTNVIAPGMYKVHTKPNQTRTPRLPQDIRKTNKRVSFSTGVIPNTSVSRPQLKSNQLEDRVMSNNSQGKKQEVEDHTVEIKVF
ncbi:hypothetical protein Tco_0953702 [Tanacetum coccineum]|uniref:Uncharacterized protein n=1 Tax=Tanacetum coccineum TaxID=301880 RepID=A0ABQ5E2X0_9ASTR